MTTTMRVALVEGQGVVREGLRLLLEHHSRMDVVATGDALDGDLATAADVVVLSVGDQQAVGVVERLRRVASQRPIVVLSSSASPWFVRAALTAGARAYVLKQASAQELLRAVEVAAGGGTYVDPRVGALLASDGGRSRDGDLTAREVEVLRFLALGYTNAEIAKALGISVRTVESHRTNLQQKTAVEGRSGLVRYARDHALLD